MANDDMAGVVVLVDIARQLLRQDNHYTYKFILVPETIGSVAYLSQNEDFADFSAYVVKSGIIDIPWTLVDDESVYVRAVDRAGNVSDVATAMPQQDNWVYLPMILRQ